MAEAQKVCKIMPERDVVTWNALIGGHADNKDPNAAIEAFNLLRREDLLSNYITIVNLLGACLSPDYLLKHGMPIHAHIVVAGFELNTTWNAILSANAHYGPGEEALKFIARMRNDGVDLDQFSFSVALATIGNLTVLDEGQQLHSWIIKLGFESN
ncbi:pentatricopeptide repeat-containing protein, partial [Trifolium medium]|nr:pentatricopeptide repeat-containing protein [Trifolium medium]